MAREIPYIAAVQEAIRLEMARDETVVFYGQDVAPSDEDPLVQAFGRDRVRVSPISETAEIGMAVGLALAGYRPVVELLMAEFMLVAMNQVVNEAPRLRYMSGGQVKVPLVLKAGYGFTAGWAGQHTGSIYGMFIGVPGLKVALPSTPGRRQGPDGRARSATTTRSCYLMHYLLVLEHGDVPEGEYVVPFGEAAIRRAGSRRHDRRHRLDGRQGAGGGRDARRRGHRRRGDRPAHAEAARHARRSCPRSRRPAGSCSPTRGRGTRRRVGGDRGRGRRARLRLAEGADRAGHRARRDRPLQRADGGLRPARRGEDRRQPCAQVLGEAPVAA